MRDKGLRIMRPRMWGLIAVIALVMAAVLLTITLISQRAPGASVSGTPTTTSEMDPTASPSPAALPTPTKPTTYTVQAGDTLSAIAQQHDVSLEALTAENGLADPNMLQIGQVLVIPHHDNLASPSPALAETPVPDSLADEGSTVAFPTMTPSGPPLVEIVEVKGAGQLETETIVLSNQGGTVSLEGWVLSNSADDRFVFPALTLFPEGRVQVHSTGGDDTPQDLYWTRTESAWQEGALVTLRDADGNVTDTYIVPE